MVEKGILVGTKVGSIIIFRIFSALLYIPTKSDETTIQMRVFLPMINEAANILDEKVVEDAGTVDLGLIFGIGFPPFRGGLLKYADAEGLDRIFSAIKEFSDTVDPNRYELSPYLKNLVESKTKFYEK